MREIDFLPDWYPQIQQRYRRLILQSWVTLALILLLAGYAMLKRSQAGNARAITAQCVAQINLSQKQLADLNAKLKFEAQLYRQDQIVAQLGIGVDTTRLLKSLEDAMTPDMSLTDLSLATIELPRAEVVRTVSLEKAADVDRRLKVVVDGVAPNDTQLATLLENLSKVKCFDNVAFTYFREGRSRDGHLLREFEFTFDMNLNQPTEGKP